MQSDRRRQSIRAAVFVAATVAILVSLRSIYQEMRRQEAAEQARQQALGLTPSEPPPPGWEKELEKARATVRGQLEAFQKGDWEKAFTFAAASFHEQMRLADFRRMVEGGFPQIAHPREIRLGEGRWEGGEIGIDVTVIGQDGVTAHHIYRLGREKDDWKVVGVSGGLPGLLPPEAPAAPPAGAA